MINGAVDMLYVCPLSERKNRSELRKKNKVVLVYCFANAQRYGSNLIIFFVHNKLSNSVLIQFLGGLTFSQV